MSDLFLPGVPVDLVRAALAAGKGNELASGKLASPRSSAALAVNAFGWFLTRPDDLPPLPGLDLDWPALSVAVERTVRIAGVRGTPPHLDAAIETAGALVGIESKRYEPFLDAKRAAFRHAYFRDWEPALGPWATMRDSRVAAPMRFRFLDAAQLVKHALGLASEARRIGKTPHLVYLYAEPATLGQDTIPSTAIAAHRAEVEQFAAEVIGSAVRFASCTYAEWLSRFDGGVAKGHAERLRQRLGPL